MKKLVFLLFLTGCGASQKPATTPTPTPTPAPSVVGKWSGQMTSPQIVNNGTDQIGAIVNISTDASGSLMGNFSTFAICDFQLVPATGSFSSGTASLTGASSSTLGGSFSLSGNISGNSYTGTFTITPDTGNEFGCLSQEGGGVTSPFTGTFALTEQP